MDWSATSKNQRGEYGVRSLPSPVARMGQVPIDPKRLVSPIIIGAGLIIGAISWPMYQKNKPLGAIGLNTSSSMVSTGLIWLLLGRVGMF